MNLEVDSYPPFDKEDFDSLVKIEPILSVNGEVHGVEILTGDLIVLNKGEFFSRISEIMDYIFFCTHLDFAKSHLQGTKVFLNLFPNTLIKFHKRIGEVVNDSVVIELNERGISEASPKRLKEIKELYNLLIALDDFGRDQSNLDRLILLRPEYVKLDMEIFRYVPNGCKRRILRNLQDTISALSTSRVIAEKVETLADLELIKEAGIELWQGFLHRKLLEV